MGEFVYSFDNNCRGGTGTAVPYVADFVSLVGPSTNTAAG